MAAQGGKYVLSPERAADAAPMFTIVTASFNAAATLGNAIESVARQSFRDFEYLVLDGGSSDTTLEILEQRNAQIDRWIS